MDDVVLTVRDDGRGFAPGGHESGLRNIRDRAATLGGVCTIRSEPGTGTDLVWTVPLVTGSSRHRVGGIEGSDADGSGGPGGRRPE
jgi:signal transduction histidine kinase